MTSPALVAASQSTRTPWDILLKRYDPLPKWEILAIPKLLEPYWLEMTRTQRTNQMAAIDCLAKGLHEDFDALIIYTDRDGCRSDVSSDFALLWAEDMHEAGWDNETILSYRFIGAKLSNDEIDRLFPRSWR